MRFKLKKIMRGKHLDYGTNNGHVTNKLFGHLREKLYISDLENLVSSNNSNISANFLFIDLNTSKLSEDILNFDSASCIHVLEHVPQPNNVLAELHRQLKIGGLLYLETPNNRSIYIPSISKGLTWNFYDDPTHIRPYPTNSLIRLCESNGFEIIASGIFRNKIYACSILISPIISLILFDWRPIYYSLLHLIGFSSFVLCKKIDEKL